MGKKIFLITMASLFLLSCDNLNNIDSDNQVFAKNYCHEDIWGFDEIEVDEKYLGADLLIKGKIYQSFGQRFSHPVPFEIQDGSQVLVTLGCTNGYADVSTIFISKQVISDFKSFPIEFELYGNMVEAANISHCDVSVDVRRESAKMCIGDLKDEYLSVVEVPSTDVEINVIGLESCYSAEAGGFCL